MTPRLEDIIRDYESISHLITDRSKKSAWFSGIGTIFKHIFGTMDEQDAIKYSTAIQTLKGNDKKLSELMRDNILMTTTALLAYNDSLNSINKNEHRLNEALDALSCNIYNITLEINLIDTRSKIDELMNLISASLFTLSFKIGDIQNSILLSKNNVLHPSVLTPKQLYLELLDNIRYIPKGKELPIPLDLENIHIIIDLSRISSIFIDNKIVFIMKIPLTNPKEYDLYKNIPVPIPHDHVNPKSYAMIIPTSNYIAFNVDKSLYCTPETLEKCHKIPSQLYICKSVSVYSTLNNPTCESELLTKTLLSLPEQCTTKFIHGIINIWQRLKGNRWMYVQSLSTKLSIECESNVTEESILGTGILNLPPMCIGYCKGNELFSESVTQLNVKYVKPDFNLINDSCCNVVKLNSLSTNIPRIKLSNIDFNKLKDINPVSHNILEQLSEISKQQNGVIAEAQPIILYLIVIFMLIFITYKIVKRFGKCPRVKFPERHQPKPANQEELYDLDDN
ncbi:Envelope fusion protein [Papilio xuthus]|uniref:Envelope fusion protein n=1 Tax=Papilio xuthus TaxID=66420 RepID=A0A194QI19_PAPXU|nr:Envelope fusion protein [Papilio xuthus]